MKKEKDITDYELNLCDSCKKNLKSTPHSCPLNIEIYGDHKTMCTCCSDCESRCADSI